MASPCFPSQLKDFKFDQEEIVALWRYAKDNYIDKGVSDISDTIHGISADLGLKPEWVAKALTEPKALKPVSDALYAKMSARRQAVSQAQEFIRSADTPAWKKVIGGIYKAPFSLAVYGHGTVGGITHAGALMFRPSAWGEYWPNFIRQAKYFASPALHEAAMQQLERSPNFVVARRAGLANDPNRIYTDYGQYAKFFGMEGGKRGFDALKTLRQDMFDKQWASIPDSIKSDPKARMEMARGMSEMINHSTGALGSMEKGFLANAGKTADPIAFAARLEASRWARIIGDPLKTLDTFARWKDASAAERHVAVTRLKHAAEFTSVFVGSLIANQALLSATGSDDKINFTDPSKSDWLKHKAFGHTVMVDGGLLAPVRLLGRLVYDELIRPQKEFRGESRTERAIKDVGQYTVGKLAPTGTILKEAFTGEDFQGRKLPWSSDKGTKQKPRITWTEFASSHAPIPLAGAIREIYDSMRERGLSHPDAKALLRGLGAFGAELTGARIAPVTDRPDNRPR